MRSKGRLPNRNVLYPREKATKMTRQALVIELERPSSRRADRSLSYTSFVLMSTSNSSRRHAPGFHCRVAY